MKTNMKNPRMLGLLLLIAVIALAGIYSVIVKKQQVLSVNGYLGGEKIGFLEDEEVRDILARRYHLSIDYSKAGSLDMVTADASGMDYLFPSSQTALSLYKDIRGNPVKSEIILNTPIVLYTHRLVLDAMMKEGIVSKSDGSYYADMERLVTLIEQDATWAEIGLPELYGPLSVDTTNPAKSNSGNMFAALLANVLNQGKVVDEAHVDEILPRLQKIFGKLGYMETSSSDLFSQFLKMGVGAKPVVAGYENQLLEFSVENPEDFAKIKDDIVMVYPSPTVWSTHVYIALDNAGASVIPALLDEDIQRLAWEKHGFRTSIYAAASDTTQFQAGGLAKDITMVMPVPDYPVMKKIIDSLGN